MTDSDAIDELISESEKLGNSVKEIVSWGELKEVILMKGYLDNDLREKYIIDKRLKYKLTDYDGHYGDYSWNEEFIDEKIGVCILFPRPGRPSFTMKT